MAMYRIKQAYFCVFLSILLSSCCKKEDLFQKYALQLPADLEVFTEYHFQPSLPYAHNVVQRSLLQATKTDHFSFFAEFYELKSGAPVLKVTEVEKENWSVRPSGANYFHQQLILQGETWSRTAVFFQANNFAFYGSFLEKTPGNLSQIMPFIY